MEIIQSLYKGKCEVKFLGPTPDKPNRHMYYVNGVRKTGVTTYLGIVDKSRPLMIWATELYRDFMLTAVAGGAKEDELVELIYKGCTLYEEKKEEAATIGDQAHNWVEAYIKGESLDMPESREAQIAVNAFLDWEKANNVKFISSERVIYSKKHDFIGKMDIEAKVNGKLCLIDIKTSGSIYNTYYMQTAAYLRADEEESGRKYKGRWIIRLAKETEKEYNDKCAKKNENRARKGKDPVNYPPYQVFEALYLDDEAGNIDRDYKAFLATKAVFEWNKITDPFKYGKD